MKQLYPFQSALVAKVREHIRAGVKRVGLWSATGTGKTEMAIALARSTLERGGCVLFLVDRIDLVTQNRDRWQMEGINCGCVCGSVDRPDWSQSTVIATYQTLLANDGALTEWAARFRSCLVFIDEAHETAWPEWVRGCLLPGEWSSVPVRFVLLTATPWRSAKAEGMLDLVDVVVEGPTPAEAVTKGFLCLDEPVALPWEGVERLEADASGEIPDEAQEVLALRPAAIAGVVRGLAEYGRGRYTLGYAVSVRHAEALRDACEDAGIPALVVQAKSSSRERSAAWSALAAGSHVVWNVDIAVKGLDIRQIDRLVVARAIGSKARWFQAVGRGMRKLEGKLECVVIDHGGNLARFGPSHALNSWGAVKGQTADEQALEEANSAAESLEASSAADVGKSVKLWMSWCGRQWPTKIRTCPKCGEVRPPSCDIVTVGWPAIGKFCIPGLRFSNVKAICVKVGQPWEGDPRFGSTPMVSVVWRARHPLERGWYSIVGNVAESEAPEVQQWGILSGTVQPDKITSDSKRTSTKINRVAWRVKDV